MDTNNGSIIIVIVNETDNASDNSVNECRHHVVWNADDGGCGVDSEDGDLGSLEAAESSAACRVTDADVTEDRQSYRQPNGNRVAQNDEVDVEHQKPVVHQISS